MKQKGPDRQKYIGILNAQGLPTALTELHHDMWALENECFEGTKGFRADLYDQLRDYRNLSVELWTLRLSDQKTS